LAEFALVVPLMLLFIAGIVELGRAWHIKQAVTDAAREGARYAVVQDPMIDQTWIRSRIQQRVASQANSRPNDVGVTFNPPSSWRVPGDSMRVVVSVDLRMGLIGALGGPSIARVGSQTTMRNE
jgi:Flp pilus assembly protein TadG